MAQQHGVQMQVYPLPAPAFTGSSSEWAYVAQLQREEQDRFAYEQRRQHVQSQRRRAFSWLYNGLAIAEIVYFIVGLYISDWEVADLQDNVLLGFTADGLTQLGGMHTGRILERHQYWRVITCLFLPAGALHVTASLSMAWVFGQMLARTLHPATIVAIFLSSGLGGALFSANVGAKHVTSGVAIPAFGVAGATAAMMVVHRRRYTNHIWSVAFAALVLALNLFIGATPFVDNAGNTAGFVLGFMAGLCPVLLRQEHSDTKKREAGVSMLAIASMVVVVVAGVLGVIGLQLEAPIGDCCDQWVCTSSPWWNCDASRIWPSGCGFTSLANGSGIVQCPRGARIILPRLNATASRVQLSALCTTFCSLSPSTGAGGGNGKS